MFGVILSSPTLNADSSDRAVAILNATGVRGGLVVHLDCDDGKLTGALRASDSYLVQGLDTNPSQVEDARDYLTSLGRYGKVTVNRFDGTHLPYADNIVNLIVAEKPVDISRREVMRVLAPLGVAFIDGQKTVKPWPKAIDEWTHFLHGSDNNAVCRDRIVSSPHHVQWEAGPKWARSHDHLAAMLVMVSANGRLFYILDEGARSSVVFPSHWKLIARDAFGGVVLWNRNIAKWEPHLRFFRSGPTELQRRMVAKGDRLYVSMGYGEPVVALDAATGEIVKTYQGTSDIIEMVLHDDILYIVAGYFSNTANRRIPPWPSIGNSTKSKRILAIDVDSGETVWQKNDSDTLEILPKTLASSGNRVFYQNLQEIVSLDAATGQVLWQSQRGAAAKRPGWSSPTLVVVDDILLSADREAPEETAPNDARVQWRVTFKAAGRDEKGELIAFSAVDGKRLWSCRSADAYTTGPDVFFADGLVWTSAISGGWSGGFTEGRDLHTGEIKRRIDTASAYAKVHHHRCYPNKATDRFIFLGRSGTSTIDLRDSSKHLRHSWVRGACSYGVLPCNGLLYAPPHPCACYIQSKISGFFALAPRSTDSPPAVGEQLEKGPAYGNPSDLQPTASGLQPSSDWPTYRHDAARSGATNSPVPADIVEIWSVKVGSQLTAPVIAGGRLFVADKSTHRLHAVKAHNGDRIWSFTAGGSIDSPPTVSGERVIFGCRDGRVYCLRARDGNLIWCFRAAPESRFIVSYGQLESVWPIHGSVLVLDGSVYFAAGRSSYLDGGLHLYRLDAASGRILAHTVQYTRDHNTGAQLETNKRGFDMPGDLPDILSFDGDSIYMRSSRFDKSCNKQDETRPHLFSPAGFLDDSWWHRTYWVYGDHMTSGPFGWTTSGILAASGRLLLLTEDRIYGFGRTDLKWSQVLPRGSTLMGTHHGESYRFFSVQKTPTRIKDVIDTADISFGQMQNMPDLSRLTYQWKRESPIWARGMVLSGDRIFAGGLIDEYDKTDPEAGIEGRNGWSLQVMGAENGDKLAEYSFDSGLPVLDGFAVARRRLYFSTTEGVVHCYGRKED